MYQMPPKFQTFKPTPALPGMSLDGFVPMRRTEAGKSATCAKCRTVTGASNGRWRGGRTRHKAGYVMLWVPWSPAGWQRSVRLRTHPRDGTDAWPLPAARGVRPPPQRQATTTGPGIRNSGPGLSQPASGQAMRSRGHAKHSLDARGFRAPPTMFKVSLEHSWRWRESNPRPSVPHQGFSGRSLLRFSQPRRSRKQDADRLSRC